MEARLIDYVDVYDINNSLNYVLIPNGIINFSVVKAPLISTSNNTIRRRWLMKEEFFKQVDLFYRTNQTYAPNFNLDIFLNNYATLKIKIIDDRFAVSIDSHAVYEVNSNQIFVRVKSRSLPHELYHVSTSIIREGRGYSGFSQINYLTGQTFGDQINEGYTSLMTERYFGRKDHYFIQKSIMKIIEDIVGQEKTENLFSTADLWGLLNELKKKNLYNLFVKLIADLDSSIHFKDVHKGIESLEELQKYNIPCGDNIREVYNGIIQIVFSDLNNKIKQGLLSSEKAREIFQSYINDLNQSFDKGWFKNEKKDFLSNIITFDDFVNENAGINTIRQ